jgi:hypothetical protein
LFCGHFNVKSASGTRENKRGLIMDMDQTSEQETEFPIESTDFYEILNVPKNVKLPQTDEK